MKRSHRFSMSFDNRDPVSVGMAQAALDEAKKKLVVVTIEPPQSTGPVTEEELERGRRFFREQQEKLRRGE